MRAAGAVRPRRNENESRQFAMPAEPLVSGRVGSRRVASGRSLLSCVASVITHTMIVTT